MYDNASSPLIDTDIATLIGGMIAVSEMLSKMFMPIGYFKTVKPLSGSVQDYHVATLDIPTNKIQTLLRSMSKKVVAWHHWAVNSFLFIHKDIYVRVDINKLYFNVANVLSIANVITVSNWFNLHDYV